MAAEASRRCLWQTLIMSGPSHSNPCTPEQNEVDRNLDARRDKLFRAFQLSGVNLHPDDFERFACEMDRCIRKNRAFVRRLTAKEFPEDDIFSLIQRAIESGERDEAFWRSFIAAHWGRTSADSSKPSQLASAARFLCAFGKMPFWTWKRVKNDPIALRDWLLDNRSGLRQLDFGNHRKYESKHPRILWSVIQSFIQLAEKFGGPASLFECSRGETLTSADRFRFLYERLLVKRFGRTGRFDFLSLIIDIGLIETDADSCYLKGATGPLEGARRLWGDQPVRKLDSFAYDLAKKLGVSPRILEDAMCIWQKGEGQ